MKRTVLSLGLLLAACQASSPPPSASANPVRCVDISNPPVLHKPHTTAGSARWSGVDRQLQVSLALYPPQASPFKTQALDLTSADTLYVQVKDSQGKTYAPQGADGNGGMAYAGGTIHLIFADVTPDPLLFIEVQARNGANAIVQADISSVLGHSGADDIDAPLNFQTTVMAKTVKALLGLNATRARAIDLAALATLCQDITGVTGAAPQFVYAQNHPSLVNTEQLAADLLTKDPSALNASDYRQQGAEVFLTILGLKGADKLKVQLTDAATAPFSALESSHHSLTAVTPGSGLTALITPEEENPSRRYKYILTPALLTLTEGNTTPMVINHHNTL